MDDLDRAVVPPDREGDVVDGVAASDLGQKIGARIHVRGGAIEDLVHRNEEL